MDAPIIQDIPADDTLRHTVQPALDIVYWDTLSSVKSQIHFAFAIANIINRIHNWIRVGPKAESTAVVDMNVGTKIRELREDKGLSLSELARQAGISKAYLSQIEAGKTTRPSGEALLRIASVLGSSVAALLGAQTVGYRKSEVMVSPSLHKFAKKERIGREDTLVLARIRYQGKQPQTSEDWKFLYEAIKRSVK